MERAWSVPVTSRASHLIFILVFITGGNALRCYECKDLSGSSCTGESVLCKNESDVCISSLVQYHIDPSIPGSQNLDGVPTFLFMRSCGYKEQCSDVVTLRTPYTRMVTSNKCCAGDNCLPPRPQVISEGSRNGLTCTGCFNLTSDTCQTYKVVECYGNENQCFTYSNQHLEDGDSIAMSGCATSTACDLDLSHDNKKTICFASCSANHGSQILSSLAMITAFLVVNYLC